MITYLIPDSPDAFLGLAKKERPDKYSLGMDTECPVCHGYGGWNLELNSYGPGQHFRCWCSQCNGWGWVVEQDAVCVHKYVEISHKLARELGLHTWGMHCHVYRCEKCGRTATYDSSD